MTKKPLIIIGTLVILVLACFGVYQIHTLRVAHSTFDNYYVFRGCSALIEKTDTYGICKLKSGEVIKIVTCSEGWCLDGDLGW